MDRVPKHVRSKIMASVKSSQTGLEARFAKLLRAEKIIGYRRWAMDLPGNPDFVFRKDRVAIFVDSCFWHGCKLHLRVPRSNIDYWNKKLQRNRARDIDVEEQLTKSGWAVLRVWEHELEAPKRLGKKIRNFLPKG